MVRFYSDDPQGVLDYAQSMDVPVFKAKTTVTLIGPFEEGGSIVTENGTLEIEAGGYIDAGDMHPVHPIEFKKNYTSLVGLNNPSPLDLEG